MKVGVIESSGKTKRDRDWERKADISASLPNRHRMQVCSRMKSEALSPLSFYISLPGSCTTLTTFFHFSRHVSRKLGLKWSVWVSNQHFNREYQPCQWCFNLSRHNVCFCFLELQSPELGVSPRTDSDTCFIMNKNDLTIEILYLSIVSEP